MGAAKVTAITRVGCFAWHSLEITEPLHVAALSSEHPLRRVLSTEVHITFDSTMKHLLTGAVGLLAFIPAQAIMIDMQATADACGNGTGTVTAYFWDGIAPYEVVWSTGGTATFDTLGIATLSGLFAGTYSITVTDAIGTVETASITVALAAGLGFGNDQTVTSCDAACRDLHYSLNGCNIGAGPPYSVSVLPPAVGTVIQSCYLSLLQLCGGTTYTVTLFDALGCSSSWT